MARELIVCLKGEDELGLAQHVKTSHQKPYYDCWNMEIQATAHKFNPEKPWETLELELLILLINHHVKCW